MTSKSVQLFVTKMVLIFTIAHIINQGSSCQQVSPMKGRGNQRYSAMLGPRLPERVQGHVGASGIVSMGFGCLDVWSRFCSTKCRVDDAHPLFETYIKQTS